MKKIFAFTQISSLSCRNNAMWVLNNSSVLLERRQYHEILWPEDKLILGIIELCSQEHNGLV